MLLATDFKDVQSTTPVEEINKILDAFKPILHIVHTGEKSPADDKGVFTSEKAWLESSFGAYDPDFYFIHSDDFLEAISNFSADHYIDLIIIIRKDHPFLSNLFKASHTKSLAYHSNVPILAIHQ